MRTAAALALFASLCLVGCDSSSDDRPEDMGPTVAGSYTLVDVNGDVLPAQISANGSTTTIFSGSLDLEPGGDYTLSYTLNIGGSDQTKIDEGTWVYDSGKLEMTHPELGAQYPDNSVVVGESVTLNSTFGGPDVPFNLRFRK